MRYSIHRQHSRRRAGVTAIIAMMFLALFSVLALGFYATVTTSVQVAKNDRSNSQSLMAAESAARFVRYHLSRVSVTGASPAATFSDLYAKLGTRLNGQTNLGGFNISQGTDSSGNSVIYVPGLSGSTPTWISFNTGSGASKGRAVLTLRNNNIYLKGVGSDGAVSSSAKGVEIQLSPQTASFTMAAAGVVSRGQVALSNGARISGGDVFSNANSGTTPLVMSGGARIDQNFAYSANTSSPSITNGATVAGSIIQNATATFPTVDPSPFAVFVPSSTAPLGPKVIGSGSNPGSTAVLTNIRVKANSNFSFGNAQVLNGVIYIESPNKVTFGGGAKINGIIVAENGTNPTDCTITIGNGVVMKPISTLVPANFAASEHIDLLLPLNGALILAEKYAVTLQGGTQAFDGAMVADKFNISNGYTGQIRNGVISLGIGQQFTMTGGGRITFVGGNTAIPGLTGGGTFYNLDPSTYAEVSP